jgi:hypothetical protein
MEAVVVNGVPTSHKYNGLRRGEQVFATYGAIAFGRLFNTSMSGLGGDRHADNAGLAMEKVFSQTLSESADATIIAVVNRFLWVIVPELANGAVIARSLITAHFASL